MKSSPQLLSQITQKFTNEYGPESMVQTLRAILVQDLDILSLFNGTLAVSKQGPKSAENNQNVKNKDFKADPKPK